MAPRAQATVVEPTPEQREWLASQFDSLPIEIKTRTPSQWAEERRYLPEAVTPFSGFYRFERTPYLREIVDCLGVDSPVREVAVMKGVQIGFTTGILENWLGYLIDEVKTAPVMWVTADSELAKTRLEVNITQMLQCSELMELIMSTDIDNARRTGRTEKKIEWRGGGCCYPLGAQNPNKFRQQPALALACDEVDGWPLIVRDGDPVQLIRGRTKAYEQVRKIVWGSTPGITDQSKIAALFALGDQRRYFVCCLNCGHPQTLRWSRTDPETGVVSGIDWDTDDSGRFVPDSARYLCSKCGYPHTNADKEKLLSPDYSAEWRPTKKPSHPDSRSYHLPALLSPAGFQSWDACVIDWLAAWNIERNEVRDYEALQTFYNNILGQTYTLHGSRVRFGAVSGHRRHAYRFGEVPNKFATEHCGSPILVVTAAVDVHKDNLAVAMIGWARGHRAFLLDYWRFDGTPDQVSDKCWQQLEKLVIEKTYTADDGKRYPIALTLVDSGYITAQVYEFCYQFDSGVLPIKGMHGIPRKAAVKEFSEFTTTLGQTGFGVQVDLYKERWAAALRRTWSGQGHQQETHFNAPLDVGDDQLKELTREERKEKREPRTKKLLGFEWHRPSGSKNELWDLLIYNAAAFDILAWGICRKHFKQQTVDWPAFYELLLSRRLFFATGNA